jgi:hypothetical protein
MLQNIVARAKKIALKRVLAGGERGIGMQDLQAAVAGEYQENEDLPNTTDPDGWARISGRTPDFAKMAEATGILGLKAENTRARASPTCGQVMHKIQAESLAALVRMAAILSLPATRY